MPEQIIEHPPIDKRLPGHRFELPWKLAKQVEHLAKASERTSAGQIRFMLQFAMNHPDFPGGFHNGSRTEAES